VSNQHTKPNPGAAQPDTERCPPVTAERTPDVREERSLLCRLARRRRSPPPKVLHQQTRGTPARGAAKGEGPPKNPSAGTTLAEVLRAVYLTGDTGTPNYQAAKRLLAQAGSLPPSQLTAATILEISDTIARSGRALHTRSNYASALRRILRYLWEFHAAPKLDSYVRRYPGLRPRNVLVNDDEREALLAAAPPHMKLWLLLCGDLAIRSGTACRLAPAHYDAQRRALTFTTKMGERLTLPTTQAIETMLDECDMRNPDPFVRQLWHRHRNHPTAAKDQDTLQTALRKLRRTLGLREVHAHDLRRTAAVAIYRHTGDLRDAQALLGHRSLPATLHYLDHDLRPIARATLEAIKRPYIVKGDKTA
jgi:integrase